MGGLNKAMLIGNLGKDPEVKTLDNGAKIATFPLATTETYKDRDGNKQSRTEWHNIVVWAGLAEICGKYLTKGKQVYIEGRIQNRSYDDRDALITIRSEAGGVEAADWAEMLMRMYLRYCERHEFKVDVLETSYAEEAAQYLNQTINKVEIPDANIVSVLKKDTEIAGSYGAKEAHEVIGLSVEDYNMKFDNLGKLLS